MNEIFSEKPDRRLWDRLDDRLDKKENVRKLKFYRVASMAAMVTALVAAVTYFNHILDDHNPHLFASNEGFTSFVLEELDYEEPGLFNMSFFGEIREAYQQASDRSKVLSLAGEYKGTFGEMDLRIFIEDYSYFINFEFEELPTLQLMKAEGQTLYFASSQGDSLTVNIEPYGLKIIDSSFLPEYKGYEFKKLNTI